MANPRQFCSPQRLGLGSLSGIPMALIWPTRCPLSAGEQRGRAGQAERLCSLEIDGQFKRRWLQQHREVAVVRSP